MKKNSICLILLLMLVFFLIPITGCGEKEKTQTELAVGHWTQIKNRAYILLVTNQKGDWTSSVRIADATHKIVKAKGNAKGMWYIEKGQMIFTVTDSDIEEIWVKNATTFFDIVELSENLMRLKEESGHIVVWNKTNAQKPGTAEADLSPVVPLGPVVANLNKNRSNDKDRYLCLNLNLVLKELMPDQKIPPIHPAAREAALLFLSSLVFDDVKDFDGIKEQSKKLVNVLNPYMEGFIKEIDVKHVIVATDADKVDEFIIEHTPSANPSPEGGKQGEKGKEKSKDKSN